MPGRDDLEVAAQRRAAGYRRLHRLRAPARDALKDVKDSKRPRTVGWALEPTLSCVCEPHTPVQRRNAEQAFRLHVDMLPPYRVDPEPDRQRPGQQAFAAAHPSLSSATRYVGS